MKIDHQVEGNTHYVILNGEIDAYTAPQLRKQLIPLTEKEGETVIIDLANVDYMDSTGLGIFVGALKSARTHNSGLKLRNMTKRVERLFEITGLLEVLDIESNVKEETQ
ncbi:STAS domain-containing protein [Bacillus taeanensis]|uniref:Anti-sigma factor antagonist n=1 Tax=Bacillus taeanensis TaxID=273032 RepID=A0A366XNE1_9BACI|nr:STAS domain-containing protein [Bacillus taeanensis]RBW67860.1 anti-anti-sigma factor [Bacillus taeanensis]